MPRQAHLRSLLDSFQPANAAERAHKARMLQLLETTRAPFSREQYEPGHLTASAFVTSPDGSALLLILHSKLQRWLQPGGHIDAADTDVLASARREVLEETGVRDLELGTAGLFDVDVHVIPARAAQPAHEHFDVRFFFTTSSQTLCAGSDANAASWVPITQLLEPASCARPYPSDESVLRAVRKLREARRWA